MTKWTLVLAFLCTSAFAAPNGLLVETKEVESFETAYMNPGSVGEVIAVAKEIVALGEQIYNLVQKGKPNVTTAYAPISIVPKDAKGEPVDPFDLEQCSMPVQKKFTTSIKRGSAELVKFEYVVIYVFGCSYNGKGKYIQTAVVQPVTIRAAYGWDVSATMKLNSILNHGTKADPNVGAMITLRYTMNSWNTAYENNDTIHITGSGDVKNYSMK